jgi:hypothetical protein
MKGYTGSLFIYEKKKSLLIKVDQQAFCKFWSFLFFITSSKFDDLMTVFL